MGGEICGVYPRGRSIVNNETRAVRSKKTHRNFSVRQEAMDLIPDNAALLMSSDDAEKELVYFERSKHRTGYANF